MALFKIAWQPSKAELHDYLQVKNVYIYIYIYRQVKVLSSQQRISPEGSQTDSQPKLEGQIYTQLSRNKH